MTRPRRDTNGAQADALAHLDPVSLAVAISKLPPNHALVAAARTGAEVADARWERREAERQAGKDMAAAVQREWGRGWADNHVPHDELERRRAEVVYPRPADVDAELAAAFAAAEAACRVAEIPAQRDREHDDDAEGDRPAVAEDDVVDVDEDVLS